jgi:TetR/AcrR family transcriptional regulator, repressor for uid operon
MPPVVRHSGRDARRQQTRQRILGAAIAEFKRSGMGAADVATIVAAAGVAHGTFYFHFPTKEHVLFELERREEARMAGEFAKFLQQDHDLEAALTKVVHLVTDLEERLGTQLCKEFLALHFSPSRPHPDDWTDHPLVVLLVREIERARTEVVIHPEVDIFYNATFFLLGVYGVLTTTGSAASREAMLAELVATALRGLEAR